MSAQYRLRSTFYVVYVVYVVYVLRRSNGLCLATCYIMYALRCGLRAMHTVVGVGCLLLSVEQL